MRKLVLLFILAGTLVFGQRFGHVGGRQVIVRPPIVRVTPGPVVIGPRVVIGGGFYAPWWDYNYGYGFGYPYIVPVPPNPCHKEKLKGDDGKKHEVLACRQNDGSVKIFSVDGVVK